MTLAWILFGAALAALGAAPAQAAPFTPVVRSLAVSASAPGSIFVGALHDGVLRSTTAGRTWSRSGPAIGPSGRRAGDAVAVAVDPQDGRRVYAAIDGRGVFRSLDAGRSWSPAGRGMASLDGSHAVVQAIAVDGRRPRTLYAATAAGLWRSDDGAGSWTAVPVGDEGDTIGAVAVDPGRAGVVYVSAGTPGTIGGTGLYGSRDGGRHWRRLAGSALGFVQALAVDPRPPGTLYAAGLGVWASRGGGAWRQARPVLRGRQIVALAVDARSGTVYAGSYGAPLFGGGPGAGVYRSEDGGKHWRGQLSGLADTRIRALAVDPVRRRTVYAGTDGGGIFRSVDGGAVWRRLGG